MYLFGSTLENELAKAREGAKTPFLEHTRQQNILSRWLGVKPKFRDPVAGESSKTVQL